MSAKPKLEMPANYSQILLQVHPKPEPNNCFLDEVAELVRLYRNPSSHSYKMKDSIETAVKNNPDDVFSTRVFSQALTEADLVELRASILSESMNPHPDLIRFISTSETAFTGNVSKEQFLVTVIDAIQQPEVAGYYAHLALAFCVSDKAVSEERTMVFAKVADAVYRLGGNNPSGSGFTTKAFESNPLTAEEIRAIPYATGYLPEAYNLVAHDLGRHSKSVARKLSSAGHELEAGEVLSQMAHTQEAKAERTKVREDDSPSL